MQNDISYNSKNNHIHVYLFHISVALCIYFYTIVSCKSDILAFPVLNVPATRSVSRWRNLSDSNLSIFPFLFSLLYLLLCSYVTNFLHCSVSLKNSKTKWTRTAKIWRGPLHNSVMLQRNSSFLVRDTSGFKRMAWWFLCHLLWSALFLRPWDPPHTTLAQGRFSFIHQK